VYFACDRYDIGAIAQDVRQRIQARQLTVPTEQLHWFALVDCAFDFGQKRFPRPRNTVAVYQADGAMGALARVSPLIVELPNPEDARFNSLIRPLLRHCNGRPMLSFIASRESASEISARWQHCLMLQTDGEGEPYLLRFADTRVQPALATLPNKELWHVLTKAVTQWLAIERTGALRPLPLSSVTESKSELSVGESISTELAPRDLHHLLKCGQADSVIDAIADQLPELLPDKQRAHFYEQVAQVCELAEVHQIEAFLDVVALTVAARVTEGEILKDAKLPALLAGGQWLSGQLSDALIELLPQEAS
jgi:hypothetical protein